MTEAVRLRDIENDKARRRAARTMIGEYHEQQLRLLLERVRHGFEQLDASEIDAFDLDDLIHRYKRSHSEAVELLQRRRAFGPLARMVPRAGRAGAGLVGGRRAAPPSVRLNTS